MISRSSEHDEKVFRMRSPMSQAMTAKKECECQCERKRPKRRTQASLDGIPRSSCPTSSLLKINLGILLVQFEVDCSQQTDASKQHAKILERMRRAPSSLWLKDYGEDANASRYHPPVVPETSFQLPGAHPGGESNLSSRSMAAFFL